MPKSSLAGVLNYYNHHLGRISEYDINECLRRGHTLEESFPQLKPLLQAAKLVPAGECSLAVLQVKGTSFRPPEELERLRQHLEFKGVIKWETRPEPTNEHDPNAIAVFATQGEDPQPCHILTKEVMVGYVSKEISAVMANHELNIAGHLQIEALSPLKRQHSTGKPFSIQLLCAFTARTEANSPTPLEHSFR